MSFPLIRPSEFTDERINQTIEQLKKEYPKKAVPPPTPVDPNKPRTGATLAELAKAIQTDSDGYTIEGKREYNAKLDSFFSEYKDYLNKMVKYLDVQMRTIELDIYIYNDGTAPGEDIDIHLHFPDGFNLASEYVEQPAKPKPPRAQTLKETTHEMIRANRINPVAFFPRTTRADRPSEPPNVSRPTIRRKKSYDVDFKVGRLKHNKPIRLDRLFVVYDSFESAKSFGIDYRINAGNVPREIKGTLHVILEKEVEPPNGQESG